LYAGNASSTSVVDAGMINEAAKARMIRPASRVFAFGAGPRPRASSR
jgi:hypothetical protein